MSNELKDFLEWLKNNKEYFICTYNDTGSIYDSSYDPIDQDHDIMKVFLKYHEDKTAEENLREAAIKALAKREGWGDGYHNILRNDNGSFQCGWHEEFYQDFKAGYLFAKEGEKL